MAKLTSSCLASAGRNITSPDCKIISGGECVGCIDEISTAAIRGLSASDEYQKGYSLTIMELLSKYTFIGLVALVEKRPFL